MFKLFVLVGLTSTLLTIASCQSSTPVPIISLKDIVNPDGSYVYAYEAGNGIKVDANGNANQETGSVKYKAPDGTPVEWTYIADANGYQPQGAHVPQIPESIARALKYIQEHSTTTAPKS